MKRIRSAAVPALRSRSFTRRTATGPIPVCTWRSGPCPCRTRRSRPSGSGTPFIAARNASASASTAWASSRRAPLRRMAVSGSSIVVRLTQGDNGGIARHGVSLLREVLAGFVTRLDTPPFSARHHPVSAIAHTNRAGASYTALESRQRPHCSGIFPDRAAVQGPLNASCEDPWLARAAAKGKFMSTLVLELRQGEVMIVNGAPIRFRNQVTHRTHRKARFLFGKQIMPPETAATPGAAHLFRAAVRLYRCRGGASRRPDRGARADRRVPGSDHLRHRSGHAGPGADLRGGGRLLPGAEAGAPGEGGMRKRCWAAATGGAAGQGSGPPSDAALG